MVKNKVIIVLKDQDGWERTSFEPFNFEYKSFKSSYLYEGENYKITIESDMSLKEISEHFLIQWKLLFLNSGFFPAIVSYSENGNFISFSSNYVNLDCYLSAKIKSPTQDLLNKSELFDCIKFESLTVFFNDESYIFRQFMYLNSKIYSKILNEHKLGLLILIIDGYIEYFAKKHCGSIDGRLDIFYKYLEAICPKFFNSLDNYLKNKNKKEKGKVLNTRHNLCQPGKKRELLNGIQVLVIFEFYNFSFRTFLLNKFANKKVINSKILDNFDKRILGIESAIQFDENDIEENIRTKLIL